MVDCFNGASCNRSAALRQMKMAAVQGDSRVVTVHYPNEHNEANAAVMPSVSAWNLSGAEDVD